MFLSIAIDGRLTTAAVQCARIPLEMNKRRIKNWQPPHSNNVIKTGKKTALFYNRAPCTARNKQSKNPQTHQRPMVRSVLAPQRARPAPISESKWAPQSRVKRTQPTRASRAVQDGALRRRSARRARAAAAG